MASEEIELNFRLDGDGRTAPSGEDTNGLVKAQPLRYEPHTVQASFGLTSADGRSTELPDEQHELQQDASNLMDDLLFDCEIADSGLMPRTFWMAAEEKPRFSLEQMALDVFNHHVKRLQDDGKADGLVFDPLKSGAEWWVQLRPSPEKAGRYSMLVHSQDDEGSHEMSKTGISFHWDKDEDLRIMCGGNTYLHAHVSTVTYLTTVGAPTLAVNRRIHP